MKLLANGLKTAHLQKQQSFLSTLHRLLLNAKANAPHQMHPLQMQSDGKQAFTICGGCICAEVMLTRQLAKRVAKVDWQNCTQTLATFLTTKKLKKILFGVGGKHTHICFGNLQQDRWLRTKDVVDAEETDLVVRLALEVRTAHIVRQVRRLLRENEAKVKASKSKKQSKISCARKSKSLCTVQAFASL